MKRLLILAIFLSGLMTHSQILSEKNRAEIVDEVLNERFDTLLPKLMEENDIDMWILISREYNEDPVLRTMLPANWLNARRRTILVFNRQQDSVERLAVARYQVGKSIDAAWDKEQQPDQWKRLIEIIEERNPEKIGVNSSTHFAIADGLVKTDHDQFMNALPEKYKERIVPAEKLAIGWIETRTLREMILYSDLVEVTRNIISEAFSDSVIEPGKTTTDDVVWYLRQRVTDLGLETWFHPTVDIQRSDEQLESHITAFSSDNAEKIIQPGDLIHCDFGITYLRLNTDCQQMAYVLKPGETEAPDFLQQAFDKGKRLQDILTSNFKTGRTGNEILEMSLEKAKSEGLQPSIYSHPLGLYGHSAGTTIGLWDQQDGVPGHGDYPLHENTVYAIELNTTVNIPEWNKDIRIMLEEAGFWGESGFRYVNGRQQELMLVPSE